MKDDASAMDVAVPIALDIDDRFLEQVAVGRSLCLYQPVTQAVALLAGVIDGDCGAVPTREALAAAGLLAGDFRSAVRQGDGRPRATVQPRLEPVIGSFGCAGGAVVEIACGDAWLAARLGALLAPIATAGPHAARLRLGLAIEADGAGRYNFALEGDCLDQGLDRARARRLALNIVLVETLRHRGVGAILHGSAVERGGRAALLVGATGAGKSTLALALAAAGWRHLSDDLVALAPSGRAVHAFPVAASVKSGSWELLAAAYPELADAEVFAFGQRLVKYVTPATGAVWSGPVGALIVCRRSPGMAAPRITPLTPEAALARLLATGSEAVGDPPSMRPLAALVNEGAVVEVAYDTLEQGVAAVGRLAARWEASA